MKCFYYHDQMKSVNASIEIYDEYSWTAGTVYKRGRFAEAAIDRFSWFRFFVYVTVRRIRHVYCGGDVLSAYLWVLDIHKPFAAHSNRKYMREEGCSNI